MDTLSAHLLAGRELFDERGSKIGDILEVFPDDDGRPALALIRSGLFGTVRRLVPLDRLREWDDELVVPLSREAVRQGPPAGADGIPSQAVRDELHSYYNGAGDSHRGSAVIAGQEAVAGSVTLSKKGRFMKHEQASASAVGDKLDQATEVISARTGDAVEKGRGAVQRQVGERSAQLGEQVGAASQTIRRVADQARSDGNDQQARLAEQAADRADRLTSYLSDVDPERLMTDAEDFARRQPWLVAGVALFAGFAVARSLKASSSRRSSTGYGVRYDSEDRHAYGDTLQQPATPRWEATTEMGSGAMS